METIDKMKGELGVLQNRINQNIDNGPWLNGKSQLEQTKTSILALQKLCDEMELPMNEEYKIKSNQFAYPHIMFSLTIENGKVKVFMRNDCGPTVTCNDDFENIHKAMYQFLGDIAAREVLIYLHNFYNQTLINLNNDFPAIPPKPELSIDLINVLAIDGILAKATKDNIKETIEYLSQLDYMSMISGMRALIHYIPETSSTLEFIKWAWDNSKTLSDSQTNCPEYRYTPNK